MPLFQNVLNEPPKIPSSTAAIAALTADSFVFQPASSFVPSGVSPCDSPRGERREESAAPHGAGAGLVPSLTSDTLVLNPKEIRHKRLYRSVKTAARLHESDMQASKLRYRAWFVTLTYRPGVEWQPKHITQTLKCLRAWCDRQNVACRYVWVAEVQERRQAREGGHCLHYHVLIFLPRHLTLPKFDKRGWWSHGLTQTVHARKPVSYMAKYASKGCGNVKLPRGARLHGCGGLSLCSRLERAWWMCPAYVRDMWSDSALKPQRAPGGGWVAKATGEWMPALYTIISYTPLIVQRRECPS